MKSNSTRRVEEPVFFEAYGFMSCTLRLGVPFPVFNFERVN
jgi:hypothetical protein